MTHNKTKKYLWAVQNNYCIFAYIALNGNQQIKKHHKTHITLNKTELYNSLNYPDFSTYLKIIQVIQ